MLDVLGSSIANGGILFYVLLQPVGDLSNTLFFYRYMSIQKMLHRFYTTFRNHWDNVANYVAYTL
jgi:hypothetical protein